MSETGDTASSPTVIGAPVDPPFVRLPDPATDFRRRAQRFAWIAQDHQLAPYLHFMAGLAEAQHRTQEALPPPDAPAADALQRAQDHAMPPLDRTRVAEDAVTIATVQISR